MDWSSRIGRRLKLRDLHILFAVVQSGNMTKAARALSVSNPVVSKANRTATIEPRGIVERIVRP